MISHILKKLGFTKSVPSTTEPEEDISLKIAAIREKAENNYRPDFVSISHIDVEEITDPSQIRETIKNTLIDRLIESDLKLEDGKSVKVERDQWGQVNPKGRREFGG